MILSYNTNGLAHHSLDDAIELVAEIGYRGIAITLDHQSLNPFDATLPEQLGRAGGALRRNGLRCAIETGARYLLDPRAKHDPTLLSPTAAGRTRRIDFLRRAIDVAAALEADCVSLWSGRLETGADPGEGLRRLVGGLTEVLEHAEQAGVVLAFEPEPGMLIDTLRSYAELREALATQGVDLSRLRLTIDVGHLHCQGELPIAGELRRHAAQLANVHIEDMRAGVHEHLMFGEGEIDFPPLIAVLREIGYAGLVTVELSRHSHEGPAAARRAYEFLRPLVIG